jgi:hypothetical protein
MRLFVKLPVMGKYLFWISIIVFAGGAMAYGMGSFDPPKKHHYFHSIGENWVLGNGYYAIGTITYDGEVLMNRQKLTGRGGFGGRTTGKRNQNARITVKIEVYKNDNTRLATKEWAGNLGTSWQGLKWRYTPPGDSYWVFDGGFQFRLNGKTSGGSIDVKVG